jgi:hypothetical protein
MSGLEADQMVHVVTDGGAKLNRGSFDGIDDVHSLPEGMRVRVFTDSTHVKNKITEWIHHWKRDY